MNTTLIVCRGISDIRLLSRIKIQKNCRYILASDDISVHKNLDNKYSWISDVCFIENMESFYNVSDDVIKILETVNQWIESLADHDRGISGELLFWIRQCEGGMTTQRIQDLLLLIRSYIHLIETYDIKQVIILSHPGMHWEDDILIETARSKGISTQIIERILQRILHGSIKDIVKAYLRVLYYVFNFTLKKIQNYLIVQKKRTMQSEVLFQLCGASPKHVDNIIPFMGELKNKGYSPVALCWSVMERYTRKDGAYKIRSNGFQADELEKWAPFSSIVTGSYKILQTWLKAKVKSQEFWYDKKLQYTNVSIGRLLWPSVSFFFIAELMPRYLFNIAIKNYLNSHFPVAIKIWGGGVLIEGHLLLKNLNTGKKPLLFFWNWDTTESPYDLEPNHIDLYFASGNWQKKYLEKRGMSPDKISFIRVPQFNNFLKFIRNHRKEESFTTLCIAPTFSFYILYDPNYILRGYISTREQALVTKFLMDFAKKNSFVAVVIKPHPAHHPGMLETLINSYALTNVFLTDKSMLPYYALNIATLLITKYSTIGVEAMFFEKPVIAMLLDNEEGFKAFGDAAEYITTIEQLGNMLTSLVKDEDFRERWTANQIARQKKFLKETYGENIEHSAGCGADALEDALTQRI